MAKQTVEETTIDVPSRSGLRGRIDRLAHEYMLKASALKIASEILDEDDRKTALALAPKKFLQAIAHRNGNDEPQPVRKTRQVGERKTREERISEMTEYLRDHPGAKTTQMSTALGWKLNQVLKYAGMVARRTKPGSGNPSLWTLKSGAPTKRTLAGRAGMKAKTAMKTLKGKERKHSSAKWYVKPTISGKAMTLFVLEHLMDHAEQPATKLADEFANEGSPLKSVRILNAPLGALLNNSYIKRKGDGYVRTAKGVTKMVALRGILEAKGVVKVGGYTAA